MRHRIVRLFATGSAPDSRPSPDSPSPAFTLTTSSIIVTAISSTLLTPSSGVMCGKTGWVCSAWSNPARLHFMSREGVSFVRTGVRACNRHVQYAGYVGVVESWFVDSCSAVRILACIA